MADGNAAAPKHGYFSLNLARRKGYTLYGSYLDNNANVRVTYVVSNENDTKDLGKDAVYVGKLGYLKYKVEVGFGFYSEKHDMLFGHAVYESLLSNGETVKVTCVSEDYSGSNYKKDDKICCGKVGRFLYRVPGLLEFEMYDSNGNTWRI
jgi:hypothetical protein